MSTPALVTVDTHQGYLSKSQAVVSFRRSSEIVICARSAVTHTAGVVMLRSLDARAVSSFIAEVGQGTRTSELTVKFIASII